jgi:hypothetical protein
LYHYGVFACGVCTIRSFRVARYVRNEAEGLQIILKVNAGFDIACY